MVIFGPSRSFSAQILPSRRQKMAFSGDFGQLKTWTCKSCLFGIVDAAFIYLEGGKNLNLSAVLEQKDHFPSAAHCLSELPFADGLLM